MIDTPCSWDMICAPVPVDAMGAQIVSTDTVIVSVSRDEVAARPQVGDEVEILHGDFGDPLIRGLWLNGQKIR